MCAMQTHTIILSCNDVRIELSVPKKRNLFGVNVLNILQILADSWWH